MRHSRDHHLAHEILLGCLFFLNLPIVKTHFRTYLCLIFIEVALLRRERLATDHQVPDRALEGLPVLNSVEELVHEFFNLHSV